MGWRIENGDTLELLRGVPDNHLDAIVTDPPAGIEFMQADWDTFKRGRLSTYSKPPGGLIEESTNGFKGSGFGKLPTFTQKANPRCMKCGRHRWSGTPCECEAPEWEPDNTARDIFVGFITEVFQEALRATKPGGYAVVWAIPRTSHWTATALENAGWEIREIIHHHFSTGMPKGLAIDKAIDKLRQDDVRPVCRFLRAAIEASGITVKEIAERFGFHPRMVDHWAARDTDSQPAVPTREQWAQLKALLSFGDGMDAEVARLNERKGQPGEAWHEREVIGRASSVKQGGLFLGGHGGYQDEFDVTLPARDEAREWDGWNTGIKPATEHWILARKPISEKNLALNVLRWGTGALNVAACEVKRAQGDVPGWHRSGARGAEGYQGTDTFRIRDMSAEEIQERRGDRGRWPANVVFTHDPDCGEEECAEGCPVAELDRQSGTSKSPRVDIPRSERGGIWRPSAGHQVGPAYGDSGGASRFFPNFRYIPKPSRREKEQGCAQLPARLMRRTNPGGLENDPRWKPVEVKNSHPTVKPVALMRWLCRLVCRRGGLVADLFMGSGTTGVAALLEGMSFLGFEGDPDYYQIAEARCQWAADQMQAEEAEPEVAEAPRRRLLPAPSSPAAPKPHRSCLPEQRALFEF